MWVIEFALAALFLFSALSGWPAAPAIDVALASGGALADARVLSSLNLTTDESLLTGESVPVRKMAWDGKQQPGRQPPPPR